MDGPERDVSGEMRVPLEGAVGIAAIPPLRAKVASAGAGRKIDLDFSGVESIDGGVAAVLVELRREAEARGIKIVIHGATGRVLELIRLYQDRGDTPPPKAPPRRLPVLEEIGAATVRTAGSVKTVLSFLGEVTAASGRALTRPWTVRWRDTLKIAEQVGANGFPVIALVSLLVGFIIAFQSAGQLQKYGADLMIADLVALTIVREMGPLMACLITVARSGSAYTAELGTMKVTEEIDALRALGLSPVRFLVLPRMIAMVAVIPLLAIFSDVVGVLGGLIVAVTRLELTSTSYLSECQAALVPRDLLLGIGKSVAFAVAASFIACRRGLATRGGAEGVGRATTNSVVVMIVAVIGLDAVFAFFTNLFHL
jgi:phospholipid/cholesterol/gamma-HCH transport system permease protein